MAKANLKFQKISEYEKTKKSMPHKFNPEKDKHHYNCPKTTKK